MILDLQDPATPAELSAPVAIIGSGAAGLTLALTLEKQGIETIVLEAGGQAVDPLDQQNYGAASVSPEAHGPTHLYRRRAFGGTTAIWGGRCIPFDPIDFEERAWIANSGWPIGHDDVARYYPAALELCDAGPAIFDADHALPATPGKLVDGAVGAEVVLDRIERFSNPTHFGSKFKEQLASSKAVRVVLHANSTEILTSPDGNAASGVRARARDGRELLVTAQVVIVAVGGIETPRLLLASRGARDTGLGNERDVVGRYYQAHIEGEVGEIAFQLAARQVQLDYQRSPEGVYCRRYIWLSPETQRQERTGGLILRPHHPKIVDPEHRNAILSAMYLAKDLIVSEYARKMTSTEQAAKARFGGSTAGFYGAHLRNIVLGSPQLLLFAQNWVRKRNLATRKLPSVVLRDKRNRYVLDLNAEQTPNPDSRIRLSEERDALGLPRIAVDWRTVPEDYAMIARGLRALQRGFAGSGAAEILYDDALFEEEVRACTRVGGHHIGTARMGSDPAKAVVDANCELFETKNVFVAGAATFPTSGFANPTLTIIALALRLGDHIAGRLKS